MNTLYPVPLRINVIILFSFVTFFSTVSTAATAENCLEVSRETVTACLRQNGWELVQDSDDIRIYNRNPKNGNVREVMARTTMRAGAHSIYNVLLEFDRYTDFMPSTLEKSQLLGEDNGVYYVFQQLKLPLIDDRYYTIKLQSAPDDALHKYKLVWQLVNGDEPSAKGRGSQVKINNGFWMLQQSPSGIETDVTYFIHTDPGKIWSFVVNLANQFSVPDVIKSVRQYVEQPPNGT